MPTITPDSIRVPLDALYAVASGGRSLDTRRGTRAASAYLEVCRAIERHLSQLTDERAHAHLMARADVAKTIASQRDLLVTRLHALGPQLRQSQQVFALLIAEQPEARPRRTPWFGASVPPAHTGWYECLVLDDAGALQRLYWSHGGWRALRNDRMVTVDPGRLPQWRGLRRPERAARSCGAPA